MTRFFSSFSDRLIIFSFTNGRMRERRYIAPEKDIAWPSLHSRSNFCFNFCPRIDQNWMVHRCLSFLVQHFAPLFFIFFAREYFFFFFFFFSFLFNYLFQRPSRIISPWRDLHPVCRQAIGLFFEDERMEDLE